MERPNHTKIVSSTLECRKLGIPMSMPGRQYRVVLEAIFLGYITGEWRQTPHEAFESAYDALGELLEPNDETRRLQVIK